MTQRSDKTAIFLGAGASAAEGAPVQSQLFREYFRAAKKSEAAGRLSNSEREMRTELSEFFKTMFDIDVTSTNIAFPTFEEILGLLDLAELRREAYKKYELDDFGQYGNRIRLIRKYTIFAMAKALADSLASSHRLHHRLALNLRKNRFLAKTVFISTNYDILIDNALASLSIASRGANLDYGVEFTNFSVGDWKRPSSTAVPLYKLHGSLNWLYCANCNSLTLTPNVKGVIDLITDVDLSRDRAICRECHSVMSPIIVPPTFYKDMSRVFLSVVWNKTEQVLRHVDHIIFCGYSFPDADMHIKYLLKRIQANRPDPKSLRFSVVNTYTGKAPQQINDEKDRFGRFLGSRVVNYTNLSFEAFADNPGNLFH